MQIILDLIIHGHLETGETVIQNIIYWVSSGVSLLFFAMYLHQFVYMILGTVYNKKPKKPKNREFVQHKIGIVISARNEEKVIGHLIDSIYKNDYPRELYNIFVVADNCTDSTKQICEEKGCIVLERNDPEKIGKGFALNFLFSELHTNPEYADVIPDAYIVLDADNIIKPNYITEMNKVYDQGYEIVTSYRNSKNYGKNWITSGYGLWFLHEARHLNNSRMILKNSCAISGTGFLISTAVVKDYDNWKFFTMTEDIECATDFVTSGRKAGYASTAELYDEQPETFKKSFIQRERWAKGYYQVLHRYCGKLIKGFFGNFGCWDMFTTLFPALFVTLVCLIFFPTIAIVACAMREFNSALYAGQQFLMTLLMFYPIMFIIGLLVTITEWKKIKCSAIKKILYLFTFPLFMYTFIPIAVSAIFRFRKIVWKPIVHDRAIKIEDMDKPKISPGASGDTGTIPLDRPDKT